LLQYSRIIVAFSSTIEEFLYSRLIQPRRIEQIQADSRVSPDYDAAKATDHKQRAPRRAGPGFYPKPGNNISNSPREKIPARRPPQQAVRKRLIC
jgi:hypothetical protein